MVHSTTVPLPLALYSGLPFPLPYELGDSKWVYSRPSLIRKVWDQCLLSMGPVPIKYGYGTSAC